MITRNPVNIEVNEVKIYISKIRTTNENIKLLNREECGLKTNKQTN